MPKELVAEASSMGWRPGYRPDAIFHLGITFDLVETCKRDDEVKFWLYREVVLDNEFKLVPGETTLTVFND